MFVDFLYRLLDKYRYCESDSRILGKLKLIPRLFVYASVNSVVPLWYKLSKRWNKVTSEGSRKGVIVSLTSFPARINTVWITVESLIRQQVQPEHIILWLSKDQFPTKESVPSKLWEQCNRGLEIRFVDGDIRPYKKYIYAFKEFPEHYIITTDDDIVYPSDMVGKLVEKAEANSKSVVCCFACKIGWDEQNMCIYQLPDDTPCSETGYNVFYGTGGGTIYKPSDFDKDCADIELSQKLCPNADDFYMNGMTRLSGCRIIILRSMPILTIKNKNDVKLNDSNGTMFGGDSANTRQLRAFVDYYKKTRNINPFALK